MTKKDECIVTHSKIESEAGNLRAQRCESIINMLQENRENKKLIVSETDNLRQTEAHIQRLRNVIDCNNAKILRAAQEIDAVDQFAAYLKQ